MNILLQQLYHGDFCPRNSQQDSSCQNNEFTRWHRYFSKVMHEQAPELEAKFNILMDDLTLAHTTETEEMFYRGFSLGVKLFVEALFYS